jgi:hypothetical protein
MAADIQPVKALYYPRTHFDSTRWLKSALLYWESVLRIVPDGYLLQDPPEVHELEAEGLIENVSPVPYQAGARKVFLRHLEGALKRHVPAPPQGDGRRGGDGLRRFYKIFTIGKIERTLLKELRTHGLASVTEDWVTMSSDLADLYMVALANEIARSLHVAPATDPPIQDVPATFLAQQEVAGERLAETPVDGYACARTMTSFRALEAVDLPIDKLLRARQRYAEGRRAFRALIQERAAAIAGLRSVQAIDSHLRDLTFELESEAGAQRRSRSASQWRDAGRVVGVGAPASIGAVVTLSGAPAVVAALGGVGSVAAGVTDWIVERRQARHVSYYLLLLEALAAGLRGGQRMADVTRFG